MSYRIVFLYFVLFIITFSVTAQDDNENSEPVFEEPSVTVYICISHADGYNLLQYSTSKPIGFMLSKDAVVTIFSESGNNTIVDLIHVSPHTVTGAYQWTETIARDIGVTPNILDQENCNSVYEELGNLNRTIALPISSDQAFVIRQSTTELFYEAGIDFIDSVIGVLFTDEPDSGFPHLQILGFNTGGDDTIELAFPEFGENKPLYLVLCQSK